MTGEQGQVLASGSLWRTLFVWHWDASTRSLDNIPIDLGKGWNLTKRGAMFDANIWLHHHGATALWDPDQSGGNEP